MHDQRAADVAFDELRSRAAARRGPPDPARVTSISPIRYPVVSQRMGRQPRTFAQSGRRSQVAEQSDGSGVVCRRQCCRRRQAEAGNRLLDPLPPSAGMNCRMSDTTATILLA